MKKIAVVTGASSGLGKVFVEELGSGQFGNLDELVVIARRKDRLDELAAQLSMPVRVCACDLTDYTSTAQLREVLGDQTQTQVLWLINAAGRGIFGLFEGQEANDAIRMHDLLTRVPLDMMYHVLPYMNKGSHIVNIASVAAFIPQPQLAVYSASKRFIFDISRSLNAELASVGISVTAVCPKFMDTEFLADAGDSRVANNMCAIGFEQPRSVVKAALRAAQAHKDICIPALDMKALYIASHILSYQALLAAERMLGILEK